MGHNSWIIGGVATLFLMSCSDIENGPTKSIDIGGGVLQGGLLKAMECDGPATKTAMNQYLGVLRAPDPEPPASGEEGAEQPGPDRTGARNNLRTLFVNCPLNSDLQLLAFSGVLDSGLTQDQLDEVRTKILFSMDENYITYVDNVLQINRGANFVPKLVTDVSPILGITGDLSGAGLGGLTLATNTFTNYQQNYLAVATLSNMVKQMDADRAELRTHINALSPSDGLSKLMRGLLNYQRAGTQQSASRAVAVNSADPTVQAQFQAVE